MKAVTALPFRCLSRDGITLGPWQIRTTGEREILEPSIPGWDYQTPIEISRSFAIYTARVRSETHLANDAKVRIAAIASSPAARFRRSVAQSEDIVLDGELAEGQLIFALDSACLCEKLSLSTEFVLVENSDRQRFVAHLPGSRLYQDNFSVQLEGHSSRFPMTTCNFGEDLPRLGIARAKWYLWSGQLDYSAPVTQGLMLYINSGRPEVLSAITNNDTETLSLLSVDVARQLLTSAVADDEFEVDYAQYLENSVGHAICGIMLTCFPGIAKDQIANIREADPGRFDAMIQSAIL